MLRIKLKSFFFKMEILTLDISSLFIQATVSLKFYFLKFALYFQLYPKHFNVCKIQYIYSLIITLSLHEWFFFFTCALPILSLYSPTLKANNQHFCVLLVNPVFWVKHRHSSNISIFTCHALSVENILIVKSEKG